MGATSKIEWTDAIWNPVRGCSRVSTGCGGPNHQGGCYAEVIAARFSDPGQPFHGYAERTPHGGRWTGKVDLIRPLLDLPLRWRQPKRIFVNSTSDLFHENLAIGDIAEVFGVMAVAGNPAGFHGPGDGKTPCGSYTTSGGKEVQCYYPNYRHGPHVFQILTKRGRKMAETLLSPTFRKLVSRAAYRQAHNRITAGGIAGSIENGSAWPLPNVWLGVSAEDQDALDDRLPHLRKTPAVVRFISAEPLLGAIKLPDDLDEISWLIAGGESGRTARPMHPDWARSLRDQCASLGIAYFFKQWGEWHPADQTKTKEQVMACAPMGHALRDGSAFEFDDQWTWRVGKKTAGRTLDGVIHDGFPVSA